MEICQSDYPLDWYQQEFIPYAEEYWRYLIANFKRLLHWMQPYIKEGAQIILAIHYYYWRIIIWVVKSSNLLNNLAG